MGEASLALFQGIFAVLFVYVNLASVQKDVLAKMTQAVAVRYNEMSYFEPGAGPDSASSISDIQSPPDLYNWIQNVFVPVTFAEQGEMNETLRNWEGQLPWNRTLSPATVGGFNRVLMVRMTAKRWQLIKNSRLKFKGIPKILAGTGRTLDPASENEFETKGDYCNYDNATLHPDRRCYSWTKTGSYNDAGGYVWFLDPMDGQTHFQQTLQQLNGDFLFDLRLGSVVLDMMVYNGNVNKFEHIIWTFAFDFGGNCQQSMIIRGFSLDMKDSESIADYLLGHTPKFILALMVMSFFSAEFRSMWDMGLLQHFRRAGAVIDIGSLTLSSIALLSNFYLELDPSITSISFEGLANNATRADTYSKLEEAGMKFEDQCSIIAFNLLIVFMRAVMLVAALQSNLGLIIKVLDAAMYNLVYFVCLLLLLMTGYVIFAFFTFGVNQSKMSTIVLCLYQVVSMLSGVQVYQDIEVADPVMAPIFYFTFYIIFFFGMLNMFVSILLSGYDIVDHNIRQRILKGEKEKNPLVRVAEEVKRDVLGHFTKCFSIGFDLAWCCLAPIIDSFRACYESVDFLPRPATVMAMFRRKKKPVEPVDEDEMAEDVELEAAFDTKDEHSRANLKGKSNQESRSPINRECILMCFFMCNFIIFVFFQVRGTDSYFMSQSTLFMPVQTAAWVEEGPHRVQAIDSVQTFEEVRKFARNVILGGLYNMSTCAVFNGTGNWYDDIYCDNTNPAMQTLQRIAAWNVGFLNSTFVRLTIQPACFVSNPESLSASGFPMVRMTPDLECADASCVSVLDKYQCRTAQGLRLSSAEGVLRNLTNATNSSSSDFYLPYKFAKAVKDLGPHALLGGYAVSLGNTPEECDLVLTALEADGWFSKNSASMVFDWMTYNGNLDMFSYNKVSFSLMATGAMVTSLHSQTWSMNIQDGGGSYASTRLVGVALFSVYAFFVLFYTIDLGRMIRNGIHKSKERKDKSVLEGIKNFFADDMWIVSDTLSLFLSIISIVLYLMFIFAPFRLAYRFTVDDAVKYEVPNEDVKLYNMAKAVDPLRILQDDWYIFLRFESLEQFYSYFLTLAALNSFFISIKVIKYVGDMPWVKVFSNTINAGKERNIYFFSIIMLMMCGFALFFFVLFGHAVPRFMSLFETIFTLFQWMSGSFDLEPLLQVNEKVAIVFFLIFIVAFFFVAQNLFLATMLNTYSETVGNIDVQRVKLAMERDRTVRLVEYPSKKLLQADLMIEINGNGSEVFVKEVTKDGIAAKLGVQPGHQIFKVNRERDSWRRETADEIMDEGIREDRDGYVRVVFKDASKKSDGAFLNMVVRAAGVGMSSSQHQTVKPTVRNFWRNQGAITWIHREISTMERDQEEEEQDPAMLLESLEDAEADAGAGQVDEAGADGFMKEGPTAEAQKKTARLRTKRRLDNLLFSRWPDGRRATQDVITSGALVQAIGDAGEGGQEDEDEFEEDEWDLDDLRDRIEKMPISGQEAWLDCLVAALEREMDEEYVITEVLRTSEMQDMATKGQGGSGGQRPLQAFYRQADDVLRILEYKANKKYFQYLQMESEQRQELLRKQNDVLHEYACELEKEFVKIMESIHSSRAKKEVMLAKLAGLLDRAAYSHLDQTLQHQRDTSHMQRLTIPWQERKLASGRGENR